MSNALEESGMVRDKRFLKVFDRHWYKMFVGGCPVCGKDQSYRVRIYGKRPEKIEDRYVQLSYADTYDNCLHGI
jgi:hypothetical protein